MLSGLMGVRCIFILSSQWCRTNTDRQDLFFFASEEVCINDLLTDTLGDVGRSGDSRESVTVVVRRVVAVAVDDGEVVVVVVVVIIVVVVVVSAEGIFCSWSSRERSSFSCLSDGGMAREGTDRDARIEDGGVAEEGDEEEEVVRLGEPGGVRHVDEVIRELVEVVLEEEIVLLLGPTANDGM